MSRELIKEFREEIQEFTKHSSIMDSIVAPILFVTTYLYLNLTWAVMLAGGVIAATIVFRLVKKQDLQYAFGGLGGIIIALLFARSSGKAEGYFLPGIISAGITAGVCVVTVFFKKPLIGTISQLTREWPKEWYLHAKVRPAYSEATWLWALFFGSKALIQYTVYLSGDLGTLTTVKIITGWPATILLLITTYAYGRWRLRHLGGPSIEEFEQKTPEPWQGQQRGF